MRFARKNTMNFIKDWLLFSDIQSLIEKTDISQRDVQRIIARYFLGIFVLTGAALSGVITVFYNLESKSYLQSLEVEEHKRLEILESKIGQFAETIIADLRVLSRQNELIRYLDTADPETKPLIIREYQTFLKEKGVYDRIRLLDLSGREVIRVDYHNGEPEAVPDEMLQHKGHRYYVKAALALDRGMVFISPFDLNKEQGEVERPFKPVIRFAIPAYDSKGGKGGLVVLNYLGSMVIDAIRRVDNLSISHLSLLNGQGYWLYNGAEPEKEWGFIREGGKADNFGAVHGDIWRRIFKKQKDQIYYNGGLYTYLVLRPLEKDGLRSGLFAAYPVGASTEIVGVDNYFWMLISHIPRKVLLIKFRGYVFNLFVLTASLFILSSIVSWVLAQSITKHKLYQKKLMHMAHFDTLTGLANRSLLQNHLDQLLLRARRYNEKFAILYLDLDGFKAVNDTLGHHMGDLLLKNVARRLTQCIRASDIAARLGGDEFVIILAKIINNDDAGIVAHKIVNALAEPFTFRDKKMQVGVSIGIAIYPDDGDRNDLLLNLSDGAMYIAKTSGKNRYVYASEADCATDVHCDPVGKGATDKENGEAPPSTGKEKSKATAS